VRTSLVLLAIGLCMGTAVAAPEQEPAGVAGTYIPDLTAAYQRSLDEALASKKAELNELGEKERSAALDRIRHEVRTSHHVPEYLSLELRSDGRFHLLVQDLPELTGSGRWQASKDTVTLVWDTINGKRLASTVTSEAQVIGGSLGLKDRYDEKPLAPDVISSEGLPATPVFYFAPYRLRRFPKPQ
jgi:hypothetical protein